FAAVRYMDGQLPPNLNGTGGGKSIIPGVPGGNVFLPSLFAQSQIPTSSTCPTNAANLPWAAKNQVFQSWVDQTKHLPNMYNMFAGNMANGSFGSNLDNSWQNPSSSQSNLNLANNPLLAAFQQQYAAGGKTSNAVSNPLLGSSSHLRQPTTSLDPLSLHPTPSALNPPIPQPKQPPKAAAAAAPTDSPLFPSLSAGYGSLPPSADPSKLGAFPFPPGYDQLRDQISASLGLQQPFPGPGAQPFSLQKPAPTTPAAPAATRPSQTFDLLSVAAGVAKNAASNASDKPASGFDLSQILPRNTAPQVPTPTTQMASTSSTIFPPQIPTSLNLISPSTSGLSAMASSQPGPSSTLSSSTKPPPLQMPTTSSVSDSTLISPRTGQKRRSGGQNGETNRPPSESGLDIDLDGIDLFEGMNMGDQEAVLNSTLNFDEALFNEPIVPTSAADEPPPPPKVEQPPPVEEKKKEEVASASSKMELLMARLKKGRGPAAPATSAAASAPRVATPANPTTPATPAAALKNEPRSATDSPAVFQKPITPAEKPDRLAFTPPLSPIDLSDPHKPSTSGISSLIAASILPSELLGNKSESLEKKKTVPVYLRTKPSQSSAPPVYKLSAAESKGFPDSKEAAFEFDDDDPEETGEKLNMKGDDESDSEPEKSAQGAAVGTMNKEEDKRLEYTKKIGFEPKDADKDKLVKDVKKPASVFPGRDRHARQESLEFAEKLRKRRKERMKVDFALVQQFDHNNQCCIDSVQKNVEDADKPPLPRLLIRLPKKAMENEDKSSRRRKKKRRYYDEGEETEEDDDDWYGGRPKKRRGRKPKRELHPDETYSVRLVDPSTIEHARKEVHVRPVEYMSKKERVMRSWREENANHDVQPPIIGKGVPGKIEPKSLTRIVTEYKNAEARERLEKFKHCTGFMPRGTFLVLKSEINTSDCSLWRVDNMNLLQKFPGFMGQTEHDGPMKLLYKNSSTYSGWCEQLQPGYMVIEVRHVKQTRSECVVEPLIHIDDLFPAISEEMNERYCVPVLKALINKDDVTAQSDARTFILKDDVRNGLYMVIRNMLDGALAFDYFSRAKEQTVGGLSNPSFELLDEMECQIKECEEAIRDRMVFPVEFDQHLRRYSSCLAVGCDQEEIDCQVCGEAPVEKTLQLYDLIIERDKESMDEYCYDLDNALPAVDYLTCRVCSKLAQWQHRLIHFRNDLSRRIEDRILEATLEMPALVPEQIVDNLRQCYTWLKEIIQSHTDTWDAIMESSDSEDDDDPLPPSTAQPPEKINGQASIKSEAASPVSSDVHTDPEPVQLSTDAAVAFAAAHVASEDTADDDGLIDPVNI
ncbi:eor-2, partial [Pristionchus pacificus]|uniref:Eor-2 n=1 Tax=Pristionchus pacificus TaxID=54126 RepID=A0A2A6CGS4_PRIPA